jgi:VIT1/CCC1 family predicted Fe2+/Mn2+ transporter
LSFEIQDLPDIIRIITLIQFGKSKSFDVSTLKSRFDKMCTPRLSIEKADIERTLKEMENEKLISGSNGKYQFTKQGETSSNSWSSFFIRKEPILELIAGLADGSVTGLVVILSSLVGSLPIQTTVFAALLTLAAVAITNFSSFFLGGVTEDFSSLLNLRDLINYSLSDIPDRKERDKSLDLIKQLFLLFNDETKERNFRSAIISGITTFLAGSLPIFIYVYLPEPWNTIVSLAIVIGIIGYFLIFYRSKLSRVNWKITMFETLLIITIAVIASLLLGQTF